jgi:hypothetical protein
MTRIGSKTAALLAAASTFMLIAASTPQAADDNAPLVLARDGYFYVNAKTTNAAGKTYVTDQMYVEERVPARRTRATPIVMVHGGTMSGVNFTGTRTDAKAGRNISCAKATRSMSWISRDGDARAIFRPRTVRHAMSRAPTHSRAL